MCRCVPPPVEEHAGIIQLKIHALEGLIAQARVEISWARQGLALCDEIEARRAVGGDQPARASG